MTHYPPGERRAALRFSPMARPSHYLFVTMVVEQTSREIKSIGHPSIMAVNRDRLPLLEDISSIGGAAANSLRETLDKIVTAIASGMEVEVCSLYLFDAQRERLVLRATVGLEQESVGKVSMRFNEGLVGLVVEHGQPVTV